MNWDAIGAIGEIVGAVAVVASIAYLAVQIRQNANLAAGAAQREVMSEFQLNIDRLGESPEVFQRGLRDFDAMPRADQLRFHALICRFINQLEQPLRMLERGLETQDNVDIYGDICVAIVLEPGGQQIWDRTRSLYFPLSRQYIEKRLENKDTLPRPLIEIVPWFEPDDEDVDTV